MKILIIDDQEWRKEYYENLNTISGFDFDLVFLDEEVTQNIISFNTDNFDLILLDVVLTGNWTIESSSVARQIRENNKDIPIVLITGNWSATNHYDIENISINFDTHPLPLPFTDLLTLEQFDKLQDDQIDKRDCAGIKNSNISYFARKLVMIAETRSKQVYLGKDKDDSLFILHLSDMQMGGSQVLGSLLEAPTIAQHIDGLHEKPDFIVITGDIAENGLPEEFNLAYEWIEELCTEIGWKHPFDRVLLVPGNHDVFAPAFGICKTRYQRSDKKNEIEAGFVFEKETEPDNSTLASNFALKNFRDFAYKLTKNSYWMDSQNSDWMDNRFLSNGVSFFGLNSVVNNSYDSPFEGLPSTEHYKKYRENYRTANIPAKTLIIALAHHPKITEDPYYNTFSETSPSPDVLLVGHEHRHKFDPTPIHALNQLKFIAPTSSLSAELRWSEVNRGFSVIELEREDRKVTDLKYHSYTREGSRWRPADDYHHKRNAKSNKWEEVYPN